MKKKQVPAKQDIEHGVDHLEGLLHLVSGINRPFVALKIILALMDGPKEKDVLDEFVKRSSAGFKYNSRPQSIQKNKSKKSREKDTVSANVSRITKELHQFDYVRIIYSHPMHDTPCSDSGRLRPGGSVTYMLSEKIKEFIRPWLSKSASSKEGVFYKDEPDIHGELKFEKAKTRRSKDKYSFTIKSKSGAVKSIKKG